MSPTPARHPSPAASTAAPPVPGPVEVAELVHGGRLLGTDQVVVATVDHTDIELTRWSVPDPSSHVTEALVGWRPPASATHLALVTSGRAEVDGGHAQSVHVTVAVDRHGSFATILDRPGSEAAPLTEAPSGWGADALRRCFGLPTEPPAVRVCTYVETTWLSAVAVLASVEPPSWADVAGLHPLARGGAVLDPAALADRTAALANQATWADIVALVDRASTDVRRIAAHPPFGQRVPLSRWFDPGSYSRWVTRFAADLDDLLFEVLDAVPEPVARRLLDALVSVV